MTLLSLLCPHPSPENIPRHQGFFPCCYWLSPEPPLEPLQLAAPKFLAWKMLFLTLLASGAKRGALYAITARSIQHDNKWKSITMSPKPGFISKTQLHTKGARSLQKLVIQTLLPCLGPGMSEDHSLRPEWAFKVYLAKTKDKHKDKELPFIPYK